MISVDETYGHHYDLEVNVSSMQQGTWAPQYLSSWEQTNLQEKWRFFVKSKGVLLKDYLPGGNMINGEYYA